MFDVLVTLCLLEALDVCAGRVVPVGAADCPAAFTAAESRLVSWRGAYEVSDVSCAAWQGSPISLAEIAPGVFVHAGQIAEPSTVNGGDVANIAVIVGRDAVAVIDSGGSRHVGESVVAAVRQLTDLPIAFAILTHMHPDHVFGATALSDTGAEIIGHEGLPLALLGRAESYETAFLRLLGSRFVGTETPVPDRAVREALTIDLGGRRLFLEPWPTAHTPADLTVFDEATGTLIAGDLIFDVHSPALEGSLIGWLEVLDSLAETPPQRVVPGHGALSLPWPKAANPLRRYLETLARDTRAALSEGLTLSQSVAVVARSEAGQWALFDQYNPRNATAAYTELEWE